MASGPPPSNWWRWITAGGGAAALTLLGMIGAARLGIDGAIDLLPFATKTSLASLETSINGRFDKLDIGLSTVTRRQLMDSKRVLQISLQQMRRDELSLEDREQDFQTRSLLADLRAQKKDTEDALVYIQCQLGERQCGGAAPGVQ